LRTFTASRHPPTPLDRAVTVFAMASAVDIALTLALYARPSAFGRPYVLDVSHYVFCALFYGLWGQALTALPFLLLARCAPRFLPRAAFVVQLLVTTALVVLGALDREFQRFIGMHVGTSSLKTYATVGSTPGIIWDTLRGDQGGAYSSVISLASSVAFLASAPLVASRLRFATRAPFAIAFGTLVVLPTVLWNWVSGGKQRQTKVMPALLLVVREVRRAEAPPLDAAAVTAAVRTYQRHFLASEPDAHWRFVDSRYPLWKRHTGARHAAPERRPNFIVLSLETFRGKDMKIMNPALQGPAPTPFLDALASSPDSAYWRRYYASGVPTVNAFMTIHTGLHSHSRLTLTREATTKYLKGFPAALREHGYRTLYFTGSDPDWDSQRVWVDRWYDEVHFHAEDHERDRLTFRRAAARIREVGRQGRPFLAYIASITNHSPFRLRESELALNDGSTSIGALHNTMHYTDDVVRELYESLRGESWFADTTWVIIGDHGFDLGDRGASGGHANLRHETTWVPLIIHGGDSRLPRGSQACVGSHVDLAPTIAELADVWDDNAYMGHLLLHRRCESADAFVRNEGNYAYETLAYSVFVPAEGQPWAYAGDDLVQARALPEAPPALLEVASRYAHATENVIRYVIDEDRVLPRPERKGVYLVAAPDQ
jgi:phosphoglycerol transferase MdoB-like AlkP superfamily enzyme